MTTHAYDGFTITLPPGWDDILEDATFSDPDQLPPASFARRGGVGTLVVGVPLVADEIPSARPDDCAALVRDWGRRRGQREPLAVHLDSDARGGWATGTFRVADDFVQVWFLSNGRALLHASYVCPWGSEQVERDAREAIVASLRFA